jgi:hypothetical protein
VPAPGVFYVPEGGYAAVTTGEWAVEGGVQLNYALLDFARTPAVRAARSRLEQERKRYANQLRGLQLQVSEAYYQLQQREQLVRVYDANLRNNMVVLQESLALRQADRAVARRQLAVLLNLPATITPSASDPIAVQPRWPLNLEQSLLEAYRGNPELEAILATREALAQESQATAAALLPQLPLQHRQVELEQYLAAAHLAAGAGVEDAGVLGIEQHAGAVHLGGHGPEQGPESQGRRHRRQSHAHLAVVAEEHTLDLGGGRGRRRAGSGHGASLLDPRGAVIPRPPPRPAGWPAAPAGGRWGDAPA